MFWRLFITQLRTTLADKATVFWTIMFPVILGTLFNFAFSGTQRRLPAQACASGGR